MPDWRAAALIVLIVGSASTVAGLAGYRLYLQEEVLPGSEPVSVAVGVRWPDGSSASDNVSLTGLDRNAFAAVVLLGEASGFTVEYRWYGSDVYVFAIGGVPAEGRCGWTYAIDGEGVNAQPDRAANHYILDADQSVVWAWDCA